MLFFVLLIGFLICYSACVSASKSGRREETLEQIKKEDHIS